MIKTSLIHLISLSLLSFSLNAEHRIDLNSDGFLAASYIVNTHFFINDIGNFCFENTNSAVYLDSIEEWKNKNNRYIDASSELLTNYVNFIEEHNGIYESRLAEQKIKDKFINKHTTEEIINEYFSNIDSTDTVINECKKFIDNISIGYNDINNQEILLKEEKLNKDLIKLMDMYKNKSYNRSLKSGTAQSAAP